LDTQYTCTAYKTQQLQKQIFREKEERLTIDILQASKKEDDEVLYPCICSKFIQNKINIL